VSVLYNGGGKIWLLISAFASEPALKIAERIDLGLHQRYGGRLSFTLGIARLSGQDFIGKKIAERFEQAAGDMQARRRRRLAALARVNYSEVFGPKGDPANGRPCSVCGKLAARLTRSGEADRTDCEECRDFEELGAIAVRASIAIRAVGSEWQRRLTETRLRIGNDSRVWLYELSDLAVG